MTETHKLAPAADRPIGPGDNNPPLDPYIAALEEKLSPLLAEQTDLEIKAASLPKEVTSDEHVAAITAFDVACKALARKFEAARVEQNKPILDRQRKLNTWAGNIVDSLKKRGAGMAQRCGPYLLAKQAREKAEAEERAREAKRVADAAAAEAKRLADEAAEKARAAQEERVRLEDEERERIARETASQQQSAADEDGVGLGLIDNEAEADLAEESYRSSLLESSQASMAATQAAADAASASAAADKAAAKALGTHSLGKVRGDAGRARVAMVWRARIDSMAALQASLGPLGMLLATAAIEAAVNRAASGERPELPGVAYFEEVDVSTSAKRTTV